MEQKHRVLELDALRGIAAIAVVLYHFTMNANKERLGWEFAYGITGVDLFFMISGFVIYMTAGHVRRWTDFVVFRFARLYPAYWCCLLITSIFMAWYEPHQLSAANILANATMAPPFFNVENIDGSYWTLLVELLFYGWIVLILITGKLANIRLIGSLTLFAVLLFHVFAPYYPGVYIFAGHKFLLINHFPLFFSGILFFQWRNGENRLHILLLLTVALLTSFYLHDKGGPAMHVVSFKEHCILITFFHILFALLITGKLQFLSKKPLLYLGKISYCLYLIHQYVGTHLISSFTNSMGMNIYLAIVLAIVIVIGIASLVTFFIEIPANVYIRNWHSASRDILSPVKGRNGRPLKKQPF
ncbi:acyltransferase [Dyadobacter sp. CY261]|uniref:acyltransferase family protein n=1 Tax=Dyadobacter sp. CY261 TaxID=2907203 RepID=UPI001F24FCE3|nr:acyltransferase [Dyadobacter sp. CY261]MCF0072345.1 acyltransferase [Dyadobacter sp. CY261]